MGEGAASEFLTHFSSSTSLQYSWCICLKKLRPWAFQKAHFVLFSFVRYTNHKTQAWKKNKMPGLGSVFSSPTSHDPRSDTSPWRLASHFWMNYDLWRFIFSLHRRPVERTTCNNSPRRVRLSPFSPAAISNRSAATFSLPRHSLLDLFEPCLSSDTILARTVDTIQEAFISRSICSIIVFLQTFPCNPPPHHHCT